MSTVRLSLKYRLSCRTLPFTGNISSSQKDAVKSLAIFVEIPVKFALFSENNVLS